LNQIVIADRRAAQRDEKVGADGRLRLEPDFSDYVVRYAEIAYRSAPMEDVGAQSSGA